MPHGEGIMRYYLAIDIGASSGRHIVGRIENGKLTEEEVYRFENGAKKENGSLVWDIKALYSNVLEGIKAAVQKCGKIESLAIDTWGVDYVLLDGDKEILPCYAYRDDRTQRAVRQVHDIVSFDDLYSVTGIQFQPFNTIYQLYDDMKKGRLTMATDFLMIPEYLVWKLTGVKAKEYTNATTTGLVNSETGEFDKDIVSKLGFPGRLFKPLVKPGTLCGNLKEEVVSYVGENIRVVMCATHDTASAVAAIPDDREGEQLYLSSGTWSLLGTQQHKAHTDEYSKSVNFSNEGGIGGYIRYQKNIMGLWMIQSVRHELGDAYSFAQLADMAENCGDETPIIDCNDKRFLAPDSMIREVGRAAGRQLTVAQTAKCIFDSLAVCYKDAVGEVKTKTGADPDALYIIGGGCKNAYLNRMTAKETGLTVVAGPSEATATGNILVQLVADGSIKNIREGRALVKSSFPLEIYKEV